MKTSGGENIKSPNSRQCFDIFPPPFYILHTASKDLIMSTYITTLT